METHRFEIAIIGAGFGGLGMAIRLKQAGYRSFVILEKSHDVGGAWRENTYPGAACDVPSHLYSFSFEPKADWSRKFAPQAEIHAYLRHCAEKYGILPNIRFGQEVTRAGFDATDGHWRIETADGRSFVARVLIAACGQLNRPAFPSIHGRERFAGKQFHSAQWDPTYDLKGKRVAVIGTGASAIQFIPQIAPRVERLTVFQRSAPYVIPKPDREYLGIEKALFAALPIVQLLNRLQLYLAHETRALWLTQFTGMMKAYALLFRWFLSREVPDPVLRAKLTPDYPIGCKRVLIANDFYATMSRPNVELVTEPIDSIERSGIRTADGTLCDFDAIIYGTGFQATDFLAPMRIHGLDGRDLNEAWRNGAEAYLGITVSGFPNLFLLYGPNTNLGHNSILYMLESQFAYVEQCLDALREKKLHYLDVRPEVQSAFNARIQQRMGKTVFAQGCTSWYKTAEGRNTNNWPGYTFDYRRKTRRLNLDDYVTSPVDGELVG